MSGLVSHSETPRNLSVRGVCVLYPALLVGECVEDCDAGHEGNTYYESGKHAMYVSGSFTGIV